MIHSNMKNTFNLGIKFGKYNLNFNESREDVGWKMKLNSEDTHALLIENVSNNFGYLCRYGYDPTEWDFRGKILTYRNKYVNI